MTEALKLLSLNVKGISNLIKEDLFLLGAGNVQTSHFCKKLTLQLQQRNNGETNGVRSL